LLVQERAKRGPCKSGMYAQFFGSCLQDDVSTSPFGPNNMWTYDEKYGGHPVWLQSFEGFANVQKVKDPADRTWLDRKRDLL
jgi:hypothetical protein